MRKRRCILVLSSARQDFSGASGAKEANHKDRGRKDITGEKEEEKVRKKGAPEDLKKGEIEAGTASSQCTAAKGLQQHHCGGGSNGVEE